MTMAENPLVHRSDRARTEARATDWASLLARAIDDLTRIAHSELKLLAASMKTALDEEVDRILAFIATGVMMLSGAICLLAAVIMFLHEFLGLPWWQSFGITALILFAIAIAISALASSGKKPSAIT
jgi:Putative Actinobacterial Holin-X, holin superfamily III